MYDSIITLKYIKLSYQQNSFSGVAPPPSLQHLSKPDPRFSSNCWIKEYGLTRKFALAFFSCLSWLSASLRSMQFFQYVPQLKPHLRQQCCPFSSRSLVCHSALVPSWWNHCHPFSYSFKVIVSLYTFSVSHICLSPSHISNMGAVLVSFIHWRTHIAVPCQPVTVCWPLYSFSSGVCSVCIQECTAL